MSKRDVMLISPDEVKANSDINYNMDDVAVGASIRAAQNIYLRDIIGDALLERLQELVYNAIEGLEDNINDERNIAYKTLLDEYIQAVLTYKVAAEMCVRISLKIRNAGVIQNQDTNMNAAQLVDITYLKDTFDTYFNDATNRMIKFICAHKDAYPESELICDCGNNPLYGRIGLWLGK